MNKILNIIYVISVAVCVSACSGGGGIGSPPNSGQDGPGDGDNQPGDPCAVVNLSWTPPTHNTDGSILTDLAGYRLYYGFQSGLYSEQIELNDPTLDATELGGLEYGRSYYFVITAVNARGVESDYSGEAEKLTDTCPTFLSIPN